MDNKETNKHLKSLRNRRYIVISNMKKDSNHEIHAIWIYANRIYILKRWTRDIDLIAFLYFLITRRVQRILKNLHTIHDVNKYYTHNNK